MAGFVLVVSLLAGVASVPIGLVLLWRRVLVLTDRLAALEGRFADFAAAGTTSSGAPSVAAAATRPAVAPIAHRPSPVPAATAVVPAPAVLTPRTAPSQAPQAPRAAAQTAQASQASPPGAWPSAASNERQTDNWEEVVGANWLNKIGVVVLVLGLGFLLAYSFAHVGPAGRVLMGVVVSAGLVVAGTLLARSAGTRVYGQGLVAGGWAGLYLTTFAAHGVPAARIISSDLVATCALLVVATGMIVNALHFRSLPMTALAYLTAYATLAETPLSGFSMAAGIPLTASLLVVAVRAGWPVLALAGVALTYLLFAIREQVFPGAALDPNGVARYLALGAYWLLFEVASVLDTEDRRELAIANAAGFVGLVLLRLPQDPSLAGAILGGVAAAFVMSALARAVWSRPRLDDTEAGESDRFTSAHVSVAMGSALFAWASLERFETAHAALATAIGQVVLLAAAVGLRQLPIRRIALGLAAAVSAVAWQSVIGARTLPAGALSLSAQTLIPLVIAAVWYAHDTWLRRVDLMPAERAYAWFAFALALPALAHEIPPAFVALALVAAANVLFARATRVRQDYWVQGTLALAAGTVALVPFVTDPVRTPLVHTWIALPVVAGLFAAIHTTVGRANLADDRWVRIAATAGALLSLALLEWRVVPETVVEGVWVVTAGAAAGIVRVRQVDGLRLAAAGLALAAAAAALHRISLPGDLPMSALISVCAVIAVHFGAAASRRGEVRSIAATIATVLLTILTFDQLRPTLVTPAWGIEGLAVLGIGFAIRVRELRFSGLAMLLVCLFKLFGNDLNSLEPLPRIVSFVGLGVVLLVVSFIYTRSTRR